MFGEVYVLLILYAPSYLDLNIFFYIYLINVIEIDLFVIIYIDHLIITPNTFHSHSIYMLYDENNYTFRFHSDHLVNYKSTM